MDRRNWNLRLTQKLVENMAVLKEADVFSKPVFKAAPPSRSMSRPLDLHWAVSGQSARSL